MKNFSKGLLATALLGLCTLSTKAQEMSWSGTSKVKDSYTNSLNMKMMFIPAGTFMMGSPDGERGRSYSETQHKVTLTKSFLIGSCEVTQKQWLEIMGTTLQEQIEKRLAEGEVNKKQRAAANKADRAKYKDETPEERKARMKAANKQKKDPFGSPKYKFPKLSKEQIAERQITLDEIKLMQAAYAKHKKAGTNLGIGSDYPIGAVSWSEAVEFCRKLTEKERLLGKLPQDWSYRLPTEAEWEYSCRAGSTTAVFTGNLAEKHIREQVLAFNKVAWSQQNSEGKTHPVGQLIANDWGLHDVYGNAIEWVLDITAKFDDQPAIDPLIAEGPGMFRGYRGLNAHNSAFAMRSALRRAGGPNTGLYHFFGLRVVCAPITAATSNIPDNHINR